jgi:hypothetical protein
MDDIDKYQTIEILCQYSLISRQCLFCERLYAVGESTRWLSNSKVASGDQSWLGEKNIPGRIQIEPPLCAEPARRQLRDMQ